MEKVENMLKTWYLSSTKYWKGILICASSYENHGKSNQPGDSCHLLSILTLNISSIGISGETRKKPHCRSSFNCHVAGNAVTFWLCEYNIHSFYGWSWAILGIIGHSEPTWKYTTQKYVLVQQNPTLLLNCLVILVYLVDHSRNTYGIQWFGGL